MLASEGCLEIANRIETLKKCARLGMSFYFRRRSFWAEGLLFRTEITLLQNRHRADRSRLPCSLYEKSFEALRCPTLAGRHYPAAFWSPRGCSGGRGQSHAGRLRRVPSNRIRPTPTRTP